MLFRAAGVDARRFRSPRGLRLRQCVSADEVTDTVKGRGRALASHPRACRTMRPPRWSTPTASTSWSTCRGTPIPPVARCCRKLVPVQVKLLEPSGDDRSRRDRLPAWYRAGPSASLTLSTSAPVPISASASPVLQLSRRHARTVLPPARANVFITFGSFSAPQREIIAVWGSAIHYTGVPGSGRSSNTPAG